MTVDRGGLEYPIDVQDQFSSNLRKFQDETRKSREEWRKLREELSRKTEREWCLAALGGADRLEWFRERYPNYEGLFVHHQIASFLGMTPVSFSRLRAKL